MCVARRGVSCARWPRRRPKRAAARAVEVRASCRAHPRPRFAQSRPAGQSGVDRAAQSTAPPSAGSESAALVGGARRRRLACRRFAPRVAERLGSLRGRPVEPPASPPFRLWPRLPSPPTPVCARRRRRAADAGRRALQGKALSARGRYASWGGRPVPHATRPPDRRRPSSTNSLGSRPLRIVIKAPIPYAVRHPYRRRPSSRSSGSRRTRSASNGVSQKHVASQARRVTGVRDQLELSYTSTYRRMSPLVSTESNERPLPARALDLARRCRRPPRRRRRQGRRGARARRVLARARPRDTARARRQTRPLVAVQGVRRGSHGVVTMCAVLQWNGL
jgi:hypothetical protein